MTLNQKRLDKALKIYKKNLMKKKAKSCKKC